MERLTTAAGMGREATAVLSTVLALVILATLPRVARPLQRASPPSDTGDRAAPELPGEPLSRGTRGA